MKLPQSNMRWASLLVLFATGWIGLQAYQTHQIEIDKDRARAMSDEMFKPEKAQSLCFGRMVFEPPRGAQIQGSTFEYPGVDQLEEKTDVTEVEYDKTVQDFEANLSSTKHETDPSLLKSVRPLTGVARGIVFMHWRDQGSAHLMDLTGYALRGNTQYKATSRAGLELTQKASDEMANALQRLRPLATNEVPTEHGFCLNTAFIPDTLTGEWHERAEMAFTVKPWEDVWISIATETRHEPDQTLIERIAAAPLRAPGSTKGMTTIRSGKRTVDGRQGEEVLTQFNGGGKSFYLFFWEIAGALNSNDPPIINLELKVGKQTGQSELTQDQALALWEYLLVHLKPRQVSKSATVSMLDPAVKLGELAATGRICPQSGWWECPDRGNIEGGSRRFIRMGERMPHAVYLGEPSAWQKLKGEKPSHASATVWQLKEYETSTNANANAAANNDTPPPDANGPTDNA